MKSETDSLPPHTRYAVSYTHLDVYKRQFETFAPEKVLYEFGFGLSYTNFKIETEKANYSEGKTEFNVKAVSYTHLDVYKRQGKPTNIRFL